MARKVTEGFVRKNITLPASFEARLEHLRKAVGAASDSELIRMAINKLEESGYKGPSRPVAATRSQKPKIKVIA